MTKVTVALRVHYWNRAVEALAAHLEEATSRELVVVADETNGPVPVPDRFRKITHTVGYFADMGLPLVPPERVLWWNGDYVLYQLADELDADYIMMIEGDCAIFGPLDPLIDRLLADGIDYSAHKLGPSQWTVPFHKGTLQYFGRPSFACIYYVVWISRPAIAAMRDERVRMKERLDAGKLEEWVFCENFTTTHLLRNGFRGAPLEDYANLDRATPVEPLLFDDVYAAEPPGDGVTIVHPVHMSPEYERRRIRRLEGRIRRLIMMYQFWRPAAWDFYLRGVYTRLRRLTER